MKQKIMIADKANSTYWWIMYMDLKNPLNRPSVPEIVGYSKFQDMAEARDINNVLMAKLEMFAKNGYLQRTHRIEVYKRMGNFPSKTTDLLLFTLFEKHYLVPNKEILKLPGVIVSYLRRFYDAVAHGKPIKNLRPIPDHKKMSKDDLFNIANYNFKDYNELYEFATKQINSGEAPGMVHGFINKYVEKNFTAPPDQINKLLGHFKK